MKSPDQLRQTLRRQWEIADHREHRLLNGDGAWPVVLNIGKPSARDLQFNLDSVKRHLEQWREVKIGKIVWEPIARRSTDTPVEYPVRWELHRPSDWIDACGTTAIRREFETLARMVEQVDSMFHWILIRRRSLWRNKPVAEVTQAARLAILLSPGCAAGIPLRCLTLEGIDTKFFERHGSLITSLLDVRFDGEVSRLGLENFLNAYRESEHWLLLVDLDGGLLPFAKMRVRSSELRETGLPGQRLLVVENESCQHQLPAVTRTIAVLGAGFDLTWMQADWVKTKRVAYWGDIDTWGLKFLATARSSVPQITSLLMTAEMFDQHLSSAVVEPLNAGNQPPEDLLADEQQLYLRLLSEPRGRLEQEFLPSDQVHQEIFNWASDGEL